MNFLLSSRPLPPHRRRMRSEFSRSQIQGVFEGERKQLKLLSEPLPGKLRSSGAAKLQRRQQQANCSGQLLSTQDWALLTLQLGEKQAKVKQTGNVIRKIRKNLSCSDIKAAQPSAISPQQKGPKQALRQYFKHLNLQAQNHCSFIGTSARLHHRQLKPKARNRAREQGSLTHRNRQAHSVAKICFRQSGQDRCTISQLSSKVKTQIGPWDAMKQEDKNQTIIQREVTAKGSRKRYHKNN